MMFAELAARKASSQGDGSDSNEPQRPVNPFTAAQPVLQKKNVEKIFTEHDFPSYVQQSGISATTRLRLLDTIRLHNPLESECSRFNLPSSRLSVLVLKDVLHLCGGLVGARFSSEELVLTKNLVKQLSDLWTSIELKYKNLTASQKKVLWIPKANEAPVTSDDKETEDVNKFFEETNQFLTKLQELQLVIRTVQDSVDPEEAAKFDNTDPESKIGKKMPDFLSVLLVRFNGGPLPESGKPANLTVGKFAVYLSGLMGPSTRGQLTAQESEALSLLLQASNDCQSTFTNEQMEHNLSGCLPAMNQKYWAQRFFNFLSVMTELNSTPKDEKQLLTMS